MKKIIAFYKMVAAGNDFVVAAESLAAKNSELTDLAKKICDRKYGIGADGLLLIEKSKKADMRMRIFNADGSEAEMCGNGARCSALWVEAKGKRKKAKIIKIETKAGIIESQVRNNSVRIMLTEPRDIKFNIPIKVNNRTLKVSFVNTGVPHAVIFVEGLDKIDVNSLGRYIRYHSAFRPRGANVNFVEIENDDFIKVRTYERGVEAETLACGTGSVASAIISEVRGQKSEVRRQKTEDRRQIAQNKMVRVKTKGGEVLKVFFRKRNTSIDNVWLEGLAKIVYKGVYYV